MISFQAIPPKLKYLAYLGLLLCSTLLAGKYINNGFFMAENNSVKVKIVTSMGDMTVELYADKAPKTVQNFLDYVDSGFFAETIFHRVIDGFMIQGGGLDKNMNNLKNNDPIENEADNGLSNKIGSIAMARTSDPHSATSQFFINVNNNTFLDFTEKSSRGWGYAVFGQVVEGMDVVHKIAKVDTGSKAGHQDVPTETIAILSAQRL